jgi:hypothetical protein
MIQTSLESVAANWAQIGVMFNVTPSETTPDLERLLVDTARVADEDPRMFGMVATWLSKYSHFIAKHRLARMVIDDLDQRGSAVVGLLIGFAQRFGKAPLLPSVQRKCEPFDCPRPLFLVDRSSDAFADLAAEYACDVSKEWGLWTDGLEPSYDALRPVSWILEQNPAFRLKARFQNDLRLSVLMCLEYDCSGPVSEAELTRRCGVTRRAMHKAVDVLWQSGDILREHVGCGYAIALVA